MAAVGSANGAISSQMAPTASAHSGAAPKASRDESAGSSATNLPLLLVFALESEKLQPLEVRDTPCGEVPLW